MQEQTKAMMILSTYRISPAQTKEVQKLKLILLSSVNVYFFKKGHTFLPYPIFWCILGQFLTHLEASGAGEHENMQLLSFPSDHVVQTTLVQIPRTLIIPDYWPLRGCTKEILAKVIFEPGLLQKKTVSFSKQII